MKGGFEKHMKKMGIISAIKILWKIGNVKDRLCFVGLLFGGIIRAISTLIIPLVTACVVSKLSGEPAGILWFYFPDDLSLFTVILICFVILFGFKWFESLVRAGVRMFGTNMKTKMNVNSVEQLLQFRKNFNLDMSSGEASYIIKTASDNVDVFIERGLIEIYSPIIASIFAFVYIGTLNPITLAVLLGTILLFACAMLMRIYFDGKVYKKLEGINGKINNHVLNDIKNLSFIGFEKSRGIEISFSKNLNREFFKTDKKRILTYITYWSFIYLVEFASSALVVFLIINKNAENTAILSLLIVVIPYLIQTFSYLDSLGAIIGYCQRYGIAISRIELIKTPPNDLIVNETPAISDSLISVSKLPDDVKIETLEIKNLKVGIGVFEREYNFLLKKGCLNCLIGESGTGKTMLFKAVLGLVEHDDGYLIVNQTYKLNSLFFENEKVSIAFQEPNLFDRSLIENIAYPETETNEKLLKNIKYFSLKKLFKQEKERKESINSLSGGEKKRLNYVRCISKDAQIYFIDEPTNDLDDENVKKVVSMLDKLKDEAIVVVVSHDSRVISRADNLLTL